MHGNMHDTNDHEIKQPIPTCSSNNPVSEMHKLSIHSNCEVTRCVLKLIYTNNSIAYLKSRAHKPQQLLVTCHVARDIDRVIICSHTQNL